MSIAGCRIVALSAGYHRTKESTGLAVPRGGIWRICAVIDYATKYKTNP